MKPVCHLVILLLSFCAFTSRSEGQENDKGAGAAALSMTATAKPASIIALSTNPNNAEVSITNSNSVGIVRVALPDPGLADRTDVVRQTPDGTLFLNRIEIFIRFSGFKEETATLQITLASGDDSTSRQALRECASPEACKGILPKQVIEVRGVKSGDKIVRYIGFLVGAESGLEAGKAPLGAEVRYEITSP